MSTPSPAVRTRPSLMTAVVASVALSAPLLAVASWGDSGESNPARRFLVTIGVAVLCALAVFAWAVPRARTESAGINALVLALLAVLSLGVYWIGITAVLALGSIAAVVTGPSGSKAGWPQRAAVLLGAAALIAFAVLTFFELG